MMSFADIPECTLGTHDCHVKAFCIEMIGGYNCSCLDGYVADGVMNCTSTHTSNSYAVFTAPHS